MKIFFSGDLHCGHKLGLTPKKYQNNGWDRYKASSQFFEWFKSKTKNKKYEIAIWNGDLIEGVGKHETSFHLTTDIHEQVEMACDIIELVGAKKNLFTYGTPYHVSGDTDHEKWIAEKFNSEIKTRLKIEIDGFKFDIMHTIGKSGTPVGGDIQLKKSQLWSIIYDTIDNRDHADYIIRSHAHEFRFNGNSEICGLILPALKLGLPDYDRYPRRLDGWYSVGFLEFDTKSDFILPFTFEEFKYKISGGYQSYEQI